MDDSDTRKRERSSDLMALDDDDDQLFLALEDDQDIPAIGDYLSGATRAPSPKKPRIDVDTEGVVTVNHTLASEGNNTPIILGKPCTTIEDIDSMMDYEETIANELFMDSNDESPLELFYRQNTKSGHDDNALFQSLFQMPQASSSRAHKPAIFQPQSFDHTLAPPTDYSRPPVTGGFITAVCPRSGKAVYYPKIVRSTAKIPVASSIKLTTKKSSLIDTPIWKLKQDIEATHMEQKRQRDREAILEARAIASGISTATMKDTQLWVEKYKPKTFMDLLGDQRINREILTWVKQWDYCVFNKQRVQTQRDKWKQMSTMNGGTTVNNEGGIDANKQKFQQKFDSAHWIKQTSDPLLRPEKKILLLSGPPGFGKTTLAHIVAKQAGYNVIEVNASDDRTGEVVRSKIKASLEMQAIIREPASMKDGERVMSMQQKPNLLIIDEIDGASSAGGSESFIKQLVQLVIDDGKKHDPAARKGKGKAPSPLLRPIICICNDPYSTVLRPLRQAAYSVQFREIPVMSIAKKLQFICDQEGLKSDLRTLCKLCEAANGDIRSCLNTLQFIRGRTRVLSTDILEKASFGQKDMSKSLFPVWEELFTAPNSQNKSAVQASDKSKYFGRLLQSVMSTGETEKIMQGCFESYLKMRFHDIGCQKLVEMSDWLDFYDQVDHRIYDQQEHSLQGYLPLAVINFHRFFAGTATQEHRVEYPREEYQMFASRKSFENLIDLFMGGSSPLQRRTLNRNAIATELVPKLLHILSPEIRTVNAQLIKPAEKAVLSRLVDVMIHFGITFVQEKDSDGQFVYKLEPPIDQLVNFPCLGKRTLISHKYGVRQLIAHEIDTERIRRRSTTPVTSENTSKSQKLSSIITTEKQPKKLNNVAPRDFFGRIIVQPNKTSPETTSNNVKATKVGNQVTYRYHEGFSNAVRKPMTVQMFL